MINQITISNFRGINHIDINDITRLCLISGKNNIGKSTVLESLFLFMDHTSNDSFFKINSFRGNYPVALNEVWAPMFYNMNIDNKISISVKKDNQMSVLSFSKDTDYLPQSLPGLSNDILAQFRTTTKEAYSLKFDYVEDEYVESGHYFLGPDKVLRQMVTNLEGNEIKKQLSTQYINSSLVKSSDFAIEALGNVELRGEKPLVVSFLRELDSDIEDIVTISRNNLSQLHIKSKGKWIPLQFAGDGVMKLLHICLAIMERKDGLVLIDEIETGFHYSMYESLWKMINDISIKSNCQVIAATHSYEMISAFSKNALQSNSINREFTYYRLGKGKKGLTAYKYDNAVLETALESELEVR